MILDFSSFKLFNQFNCKANCDPFDNKEDTHTYWRNSINNFNFDYTSDDY